MPTLPLTIYPRRTPVVLRPGRGPRLSAPFPQLRAVVRFPGSSRPYDAILDTGAPHTLVAEPIWAELRDGIDFEWLPVAGATGTLSGVVIGNSYRFRFARFRSAVALTGGTTRVLRPTPVVQFADGDPLAATRRSGPPVVLLGLWGGLLDDSTLRLSTDPATGRLAAALEFA